MKVSGKKVAEHRAALLATARRLLQEQGFDGAGVAEISREAGLTQGALYGQFKSKSALAKEAVCKAFSEGAASWRELRQAAPDALSAYLDAYLWQSHGGGCLLAACVSDVARQDESIGAAFAEGFRNLVVLVEDAFPEGISERGGTSALAHPGLGDDWKRRHGARVGENRSGVVPRDHRGRQGRTGPFCDR